MSNNHVQGVLSELRRRNGNQDTPVLPDANLLDQWSNHRDEAAFELLLRRHGPMVFALCRRLLGHTQDAEDAFQATFLVLVRKSNSINKRTALGSWLYKVAYRVALRAKAKMIARPTLNGGELDQVTVDPGSDLIWRDLRPVLDEEILRLPAKYRDVFVLCHLQGKTNEEAAQELGCPLGTVLSRLSRARERLRAGLSRRGLALTAAALAAALGNQAANAGVPPFLTMSTLKTSLLFAASRAATVGEISTQVASLTEGVLKAMYMTKIKSVAIVMLSVCFIGSGAGLVSYHSLAQDSGDSPAQKIPAIPMSKGQTTARLAVTLQTGNSPVLSLAVSPDAETLVSASQDGSIRFWETDSGRQIRLLSGHADGVTGVAFTPDGKTLASSGNDGKVMLWDVQTGKQLVQYQNKDAILSLSVSPDGRLLAFGGKDQTIRLLDARTGREVRRFLGQTKGVSSVVFSATGRWVASGSADRTVVLWSPETGEQLQRIRFKKAVGKLAMTPDGKWVAAATKDGNLHLIDSQTGKWIRQIRAHNDIIYGIAVSPDGKWVATGAKDKTFRVWNVKTGARLFMGVHKGPVTSVAFSPDGKYLVTGSRDSTVKIWIVVPGKSTLVWQKAKKDRLAELADALIKQKKSDEQCVESLYLATLSRFPTNGEKQAMMRQLSRNNDRRAALENVLFALTASREFSANVSSLRKRDLRKGAGAK